MNEIIRDIYENGTVGRSGQRHKVTAGIDKKEGEFIYSIIKNNSTICNTLEVGCAFGISSLYICSALKGRSGVSHTIIDPNQKERDDVGIINLETAGIKFFKLESAKSEFVLPRLLEKKENQFDLIFIDGWHTFDHTLLDCFYATRLLRVGGILILDDASWPSVRRAVSYLKNYPCYEELGGVVINESISCKKAVARFLMTPVRPGKWSKVLSASLIHRIFGKKCSMVALKKIAEDTRKWNWHNDSF